MRSKYLVMVLIVALLAAGCSSGVAPSSPEESDSSAGISTQVESKPALATGILTTDYDDALSLRNQLALGTLRLEGDLVVSPEQSEELLILWQALAALSVSATAAAEEINAVQNQIVNAMTEAQLEAIAGCG
jgi:hypothetical protein